MGQAIPGTKGGQLACSQTNRVNADLAGRAGKQQDEASLGTRTLLPEERRRVALPGQATRTRALARSPACHVAGPAGVQAAGQGYSQSLSSSQGWNGRQFLGHYPSPRYFCAEMNWEGIQREKHEPVFAGWIPELHLEGRVQKTVHWLTHANTVHRTRTNSLE